MYSAMNRFRIAPGRENVFEELWRSRDSKLDDVPGFREFHLLKGPSDEEATLYASHTVWDSRENFEAWTNSDAFRAAHAKARAPEGTYLTRQRGLWIWRDAFAAVFQCDSEGVELADAFSTMRSACFCVAVLCDTDSLNNILEHFAPCRTCHASRLNGRMRRPAKRLERRTFFFPPRQFVSAACGRGRDG